MSQKVIQTIGRILSGVSLTHGWCLCDEQSPVIVLQTMPNLQSLWPKVVDGTDISVQLFQFVAGLREARRRESEAKISAARWHSANAGSRQLCSHRHFSRFSPRRPFR
jgi:hypothetical protein